MKKIVLFIIIISIIFVGLFFYKDKILPLAFQPTKSITLPGDVREDMASPEVVVKNLSIPWELVFLPNGDMLLTERAGRLIRVGSDQNIIEVSGVTHRGEGGLLGLALHPNFSQNNFIYIYLTVTNDNILTNRVERYVLGDDSLEDHRIIIENIPGASNHDGGRIAFGPDGMLYITTGDAGNEETSQDKNNLAGKILRITPDGEIPSDNPFGNAVYSYGHRNSQGIAWDSSGQLWSTEHGRSGLRSGFDEVNKIMKGGNYGWPHIQGNESEAGMITPEINSGASETWAPGGMVIVNNTLIFTGLRGESIYTSNITNGNLGPLRAYFKSSYGRLRGVTLGPDEMLYVITNNRDGRGDPISEDDRVIKIDPKTFE